MLGFAKESGSSRTSSLFNTLGLPKVTDLLDRSGEGSAIDRSKGELPIDVYAMGGIRMINTLFPEYMGTLYNVSCSHDHAHHAQGFPDDEVGQRISREIALICFTESLFFDCMRKYKVWGNDEYSRSIKYLSEFSDILLYKELTHKTAITKLYNSFYPEDNLKSSPGLANQQDQPRDPHATKVQWVHEMKDRYRTNRSPSELILNAYCKLWCGRTMRKLERQLIYRQSPKIERSMVYKEKPIYSTLSMGEVNFGEAAEIFGVNTPINLTKAVS